MKSPLRILPVTALLLALAAGLGGCIPNDIPYPHIQANILRIAAAGETRGAAIDSINRTVMFYLPEEVDIYAVKIDSFTLTPEAYVVDDAFSRPLNLAEPCSVNIHLYYDYSWTLTAQQSIERYFSVEGQVGSSMIDLPAHRVVATVTESYPLDNILVETIKLGATGSTMTPDLSGQRIDFRHPVEVTVNEHGRESVWTIYVDQTESKVSTERVDAWTCVAWLYCSAEAGRPMGAQYRMAGDEIWTQVPDDWITSDGGSYTARLIHLSPGTTYEARAVSAEETGSILTFTTGLIVQPPNMNFDQWWLDGKIWCPWAEGSDPYWGTGNKGATTLGPSNTIPTEETVSGQGYAAELQTKFVGIGALGKLAAGNIFVGSYVATDGTNGILSFGRPFTERPTKLKGYLKYKTAPVSSVTSGFEYMKGQPDTCIVWCALIDQAEPFEIRTRPSNRQLFDPEGSYVVAYGKVEFGEDIPSYIPFEFDLKYTSTSRVPRYILITGSASKYGDFFTGGNGAVLTLDDFELVFDY